MKVRLGDILHIKHGYAFKGDYFTDENTGKLVLTPGNFSLKGGFQQTKKFTKEEDFPQEFILKPGDLIVTMTDLSKEIDTIGYSALVPKDNLQYLHNQRIGLVTINDDNYDYGFIYWLMRSKHYQRSIANTSNGATVHHTSPDRIYKYQFDRISLAKQRCIASILSAYDNLIENNTRRIRLLEQMAENLYKEWFVRFRFPGHENVEFENGLPKGWKVMKLDKILTVKYGKDHSKIEDGDIPILGSGGIMRYGNKKLYASESVLIPRKGSLNNIMYIDEPFWTVDTMFFTEMKYKNIAKYIYYVLSGIDMESFNAGAALPSMTTNILNHFKVILPSENVLAIFDEKVGLLYNQKKKLIQQNENLSRQRDLLLPRLMSGKLEVNI